MDYNNFIFLYGGNKKYKILKNFYKFKNIKNKYDNNIFKWKEDFHVYHEFPDNINKIIKFVGKKSNILEVGSGAGIIPAMIAHDSNINITCT